MLTMEKYSERITKTIVFFPKYTKMPTLSSAEVAVASARSLADALCNPQPATPFQIGDKVMQDLQCLSEYH